MEIRLIGEVRVLSEGRGIGPVSPTRQLLVAALAAEHGRTVSGEELIRRVWSEQELDHARRQIHQHLRKLRRELEAGRPEAGEIVQAHAGGWRITLDPEQVDEYRFQVLHGRVLAAGDARERARLAEQALAEWAGDVTGAPPVPLAGLPGTWAEGQRRAMLEDYKQVRLAWLEAHLALGPEEWIVSDALRLAKSFPFDDGVQATLIRALHRLNGAPAAIEAWERYRDTLRQAYDTEPGPELHGLYQDIRAHTHALAPVTRKELRVEQEEPVPDADEAGVSAENKGVLATGAYGVAIGTQWNVSGSHARIQHADRDIRIEQPADER
ncbi:DNA-binding SARP family transcriptional activator [Thermocatellispora tengchongensis]|uniref:DNA-binding SARP family transcriptional activator n=1 Tax=Thermocatellispora tengchongensis TaxID=1073253 RepID=A0A840PRQ2_9ACTN|nr:BTAD domain-containing putative transcriptional regulator [Thermocatellispora tengchongensis]MBB5138645.1 DNA-binding SARP family transcriptional activator [Thermocatellispora tengchongensis]